MFAFVALFGGFHGSVAAYRLRLELALAVAAVLIGEVPVITHFARVFGAVATEVAIGVPGIAGTIHVCVITPARGSAAVVFRASDPIVAVGRQGAGFAGFQPAGAVAAIAIRGIAVVTCFGWLNFIITADEARTSAAFSCFWIALLTWTP